MLHVAQVGLRSYRLTSKLESPMIEKGSMSNPVSTHLTAEAPRGASRTPAKSCA